MNRHAGALMSALLLLATSVAVHAEDGDQPLHHKQPSSPKAMPAPARPEPSSKVEQWREHRMQHGLDADFRTGIGDDEDKGKGQDTDDD
jgi:hypothetical protein